MRVTHDPEADAMYVYLSEKSVDRTVRVSDHVVVDLDAEGNLRGIELLFVSRSLADADFSHIHLELPRVGTVDLHLPSPMTP